MPLSHALAPLAALVFALPGRVDAPAPALADGWRFKWMVSAGTPGAAPAPASGPGSMSVALVPGKARMEFAGANPMGRQGGFMILDATAGTMTMVDAERREAMVIDPEAMGGAIAGMGIGGMVKTDVRDIAVDVTPLGSGERLLGYATTRYRIVRAYTMAVTVMGRTTTTRHRSEGTVWIAERFMDDPAFELWAKRFASSFGRASGEGLRKLVDAESAKAPKGMALKQVLTSTDTDDKGVATTTTTTMEMTELKRASIPDADFQVPSGYKVVDTRAQMAEAQAEMAKAKAECEAKNGAGSEKCDLGKAMEGLSLDSVMARAKDGAKEDAKKDAKDAAKDAAKKALRGIFKKP